MGVNDGAELPSIRLAAAVLLSRASQVWLGQRGKTRFLPGFWVFPGGGVDPEESFEAAARREVEEETQVRLSPSEPLRPFARAITPAYSPIRYDARVFQAELSAGIEPVVDGLELKQGRWFEVEEMLALSQRGEVQLAPPTYRQLSHYLDILRGVSDWPTAEQAFAPPPAEHEAFLSMVDGVTVIPLPSPTLPPAGWTNTLLVGRRRLFVIDPGGPDPSRLCQEIARRQEGGAEVVGVILTHHHPDHLDGYLALGLGHLPLYCHPLTAPLLPADFPLTTPWKDGEILRVESDLTLLAHWTPGHAPGHLAIEVPERKLLLAADLISSLSSIVIPTSNGDLVDYLGSLARMRALDCHLIIPSHGPPYGQGSDPFGQGLAHRQLREEQIVRCLAASDRPLLTEEVTERLYRGLDSRLVPAARANVWQHLRKLRAEDRVQERDDVWSLSPTVSPLSTVVSSRGH